MGQDRLNALAFLSIKAKLVQEIDYGDIIDFLREPKLERRNWSLKLIKKMYFGTI